jgi:amidophosphoribosyltransferase
MSGIFGIVMGEGDCSETLLYGTDYHSHLGTAYGGMAVLGEEFFRQIHSISQSQFKSKFFDDARVMRGNKGIGAISDFDEQPIYLKSKFGPFCVVMNGFIDNAQELADELLTRGFSFSEVSHNKVNMTELVAKLITRGSDIPDGIEKALRVIKGSCSLLVLNNDGVYAARDRFGYSPLTIGKSDAGWAITTETAAFPNTGFEPIKHLEPGEIVLVAEKGLAQKRKGSGCPRQICLFLWIYTGFPASTYEGINVEVVRERCGVEPEESTGGGTSDARFIAPLGAQVVEMGPVNASIHRIDEHVALDELERLPALYEAVASRLLAGS